MAIVQNPVTGTTRQTFGNAIFSKQFGKNTMRSKPLDVKRSNTPSQENHRRKFAVMSKLLLPLVRIINSAYAGTISNMSPFNKVFGINMRNAFTSNPPVVDHTKVVLCDFTGSMVGNVVLKTNPNQGVHVEWDPNTTVPEELGSNLTFVLFNCTTNEAQVIRNVALRSAGIVDFTVPRTWVGSMTALHIITTDCSQLIAGNPKTIINFMAGADEASIIK